MRDTGVGIPNAVGNSIFERFMKVERSTNRLYSGTGLGLAITKSLVSKMGGEIWYESAENKGTTFYFTLPEFGSSVEKGNNPFEINQKEKYAGKKVLLIDNDTSNYLVFASLLSDYKIEAVWGRTISEAIEIIKRDIAIDLIIADTIQIEKEGKEFLKKLKQQFPAIPLVGQTNTEQSNRQEINIDLYQNQIDKPLIIIELIKLFENYF